MDIVMTDKQFCEVWQSAYKDTTDRDTFADKTALPDVDPETIKYIWDVAHMGTKGMRKAAGLKQWQLSERFCITKRTVERWDANGDCPSHVYLMLAQLLGLIKR